MSRPVGPRVAWGALERYIGPITYQALGFRAHARETAHAVIIGELVGLSARTIFRYKTDGVPLARADEIACRLGTHPALIWPEGFDLDIDVAV